jgi:hypothetical protein
MLTKLHLHHQDATGRVDDQESAIKFRSGDAAYGQGWKDPARSSRKSLHKMKDMTAADLDAAVRTIAGSARSMVPQWKVLYEQLTNAKSCRRQD